MDKKIKELIYLIKSGQVHICGDYILYSKNNCLAVVNIKQLPDDYPRRCAIFSI